MRNILEIIRDIQVLYPGYPGFVSEISWFDYPGYPTNYPGYLGNLFEISGLAIYPDSLDYPDYHIRVEPDN